MIESHDAPFWDRTGLFRSIQQGRGEQSNEWGQVSSGDQCVKRSCVYQSARRLGDHRDDAFVNLLGEPVGEEVKAKASADEDGLDLVEFGQGGEGTLDRLIFLNQRMVGKA